MPLPFIIGGLAALGSAAAAVGGAAVTVAGTAATAVGGTVVAAATSKAGIAATVGIVSYAIGSSGDDRIKEEGYVKASNEYEPKLRKQEEQISQLKKEIKDMKKRFEQDRKKYLQQIEALTTVNKALEDKLAESKVLEEDMLKYIKELEDEKNKWVSKLGSTAISNSESNEIEVSIREIRNQIDSTKAQLEKVKLLRAG